MERFYQKNGMEQQNGGAESEKSWLERYSDVISKDETIVIKDKAFVFSGVEGSDEWNNILQSLTNHGGIYRAAVSGKTDYLVCNPAGAGGRKLKMALEQRSKGKGIKIILISDLLDALGMSVSTHHPDTAGDFVIHDGILTAYKGTASEVVIPDGTASVGSRAFILNDSIRSVVIPDSVHSIGEKAFMGCHFLEQIRMPSALQDLGEFAFCNCYRLKGITVPQGLKVIAECTFENCYEIHDFVIPEGVETIGECAFEACGAEKIILPESLRTIENSAFHDCRALKEMNISEGVEKIGKGAFAGCSSYDNPAVQDFANEEEAQAPTDDLLGDLLKMAAAKGELGDFLRSLKDTLNGDPKRK